MQALALHDRTCCARRQSPDQLNRFLPRTPSTATCAGLVLRDAERLAAGSLQRLAVAARCCGTYLGRRCGVEGALRVAAARAARATAIVVRAAAQRTSLRRGRRRGGLPRSPSAGAPGPFGDAADALKTAPADTRSRAPFRRRRRRTSRSRSCVSRRSTGLGPPPRDVAAMAPGDARRPAQPASRCRRSRAPSASASGPSVGFAAVTRFLSLANVQLGPTCCELLLSRVGLRRSASCVARGDGPGSSAGARGAPPAVAPSARAGARARARSRGDRARVRPPRSHGA
jgi:hypothetical protein